MTKKIFQFWWFVCRHSELISSATATQNHSSTPECWLVGSGQRASSSAWAAEVYMMQGFWNASHLSTWHVKLNMMMAWFEEQGFTLLSSGLAWPEPWYQLKTSGLPRRGSSTRSSSLPGTWPSWNSTWGRPGRFSARTGSFSSTCVTACRGGLLAWWGLRLATPSNDFPPFLRTTQNNWSFSRPPNKSLSDNLF